MVLELFIYALWFYSNEYKTIRKTIFQIQENSILSLSLPRSPAIKTVHQQIFRILISKMTFFHHNTKIWIDLGVATLCLILGVILCLSIILIPHGNPWTDLQVLGHADLGIPGALLIILSLIPLVMFFHLKNLNWTKATGLNWRKQAIRELILMQAYETSLVNKEDKKELIPSQSNSSSSPKPSETVAMTKVEEFDEIVSIPEGQIPANADDFVVAFHLNSPSQSFFPKFE